MSIINDALKKVQTQMNENDKSQPSPPGNSSEPQNPSKPINVYEKLHKKNSPGGSPADQQKPAGKSTGQATATSKSPEDKEEKKRLKPILSGIFLAFYTVGLLTLVAVYLLKYNPAVKKYLKENPRIAAKLRLSSPKRIFSFKPKPAAALPSRVYDENALYLNGTAVVGNNKSAIINDKIYQLGDTVSGRKIVDIGLKGISLEAADGSITSLTTDN